MHNVHPMLLITSKSSQACQYFTRDIAPLLDGCTVKIKTGKSLWDERDCCCHLWKVKSDRSFDQCSEFQAYVFTFLLNISTGLYISIITWPKKKYDFFFCPCQIWELWNDHKRVISLRLLDLGKYLHAISLCIFTEQNLDISIKLVTVKEVLRQLKCSNSFIVGRGLLTIAEGEKSRPHSRGRRLRELTLRLTWATNFDEK